MRLVAEYLENTAQLLLRLLQEPSVPGDLVQTGTYVVDGTPMIPDILDFEISGGDIRNSEAHIYLTGYWPLPEWLNVTLPDASEARVQVVQVLETGKSIISDQPIEANKPIEQDDRRPGESANPYVPEPTLPPEYPDIWVELSLERTNPVRLGASMESDSLVYLGGCEDRALSSTQRQQGEDTAPYLSYAPLRLEGGFSNSLPNSNFTYDNLWPSPYFDPLPAGWSVELADPLSLLRIQADSRSVLPSMTLRFRHRVNTAISPVPPVTVYTPAIPNTAETFQVILQPAMDTVGRVRLSTENDAAVSSWYSLLDGKPVLASLPIGVNAGRIKLVWDTPHDGEQVLQLVAPAASLYDGAHSWLPTGSTSGADSVTLPNITYNKPWYLYRGSVRVDGQGDRIDQPYSWRIGIGSQTFLKVEEGFLSSDFMTAGAVELSAHQADVSSYKLLWTSQTDFKLRTNDGATTADLPFELDISTIIGSTAPLETKLTSWKAGEGSAVAARWAWLPN